MASKGGSWKSGAFVPASSKSTQAKLPEGVTAFKSSSVSRYSFSVAGQTVDFAVLTDGKSGNVQFSVGDSFERGKLVGRDADRAALTIARIFQHDISTRPNGFRYDTAAFTPDGYGAKRAASYEKIGFSAPVGGRPGGAQYAIVKNGKLVPDTKRLKHPLPEDQTLADLFRFADSL